MPISFDCMESMKEPRLTWCGFRQVREGNNGPVSVSVQISRNRRKCGYNNLVFLSTVLPLKMIQCVTWLSFSHSVYFLQRCKRVYLFRFLNISLLSTGIQHALLRSLRIASRLLSWPFPCLHEGNALPPHPPSWTENISLRQRIGQPFPSRFSQTLACIASLYLFLSKGARWRGMFRFDGIFYGTFHSRNDIDTEIHPWCFYSYETQKSAIPICTMSIS